MRTVRGVAVWLGVTLSTAALLAGLSPQLTTVGGRLGTAPAAGFEELLVGLAAVVLACCGLWCWAVTTVAVAGVLAGVDLTRLGAWAGPTVVRRAVLAACGLGLAAGVAAPAGADTASGPVHDGSTAWTGRLSQVGASLSGDPRAPSADRAPAGLRALTGLPLPERPSAPARRPAPPERGPASPPGDQVVVRPGDTLWALTARTLPAGTPDPVVAHAWPAVYRVNARVIGADPDLIQPGTTLHLPPPSPPEETS